MLDLKETICHANAFEFESEVRSYCRGMPAVFRSAANAELWDENGRRYIDLLSSCGAVNYGHNSPVIRDAVVSYLLSNGITTSMDLHTTAKRSFLEAFQNIILAPRGLEYKVQFCGPTGTNAVEAALKLARKYTGRSTVMAFKSGYHGMTLGALAVTSNQTARRAAGVPLTNAVILPYDCTPDGTAELSSLIESAVLDRMSAPAALIVETVQGEGGLNTATKEWLQELQRAAHDLGALLIVDDIQAGCGRTGPFFSFEEMGIEPDIVCLSKSIGGMGLPMALVLMRPEIDVWRPGEHTGTFRGNNLAFTAALAALEFWRTQDFQKEVERKAWLLASMLDDICIQHDGKIRRKGRGLMQGLEFQSGELAGKVAAICFADGIVVECCGARGEVLKFLPPLTIPQHLLMEAVNTVSAAIKRLLGSKEALRIEFAA